MKEKINYYLLKTIAVVIALFCLSQIFLSIYLFGTTEMSKVANLFYPYHTNLFRGILFVFLLFGIDWTIGFLGSMGLFFFKKIGYFLTILAILFYWFISLIQEGGPIMHWQVLIFATLIFIYLLFQKKNIENFHNSNSLQGRKTIAILSIIFILTLSASLIWLKTNISSLQKQSNLPTNQTQTAPTEKDNEDNIEVVNTNMGQIIKFSLSVPISTITSKASEIAGFHIYYPSFVPREFKREFAIINVVSVGASADCSLSDSKQTPTSPSIIILERPINSVGGDFMQKGADALTSKQEVDINGNKGIAGNVTNSYGNFSRIYFITKDETAIYMNTKDFNVDLLLKIARSIQ